MTPIVPDTGSHPHAPLRPLRWIRTAAWQLAVTLDPLIPAYSLLGARARLMAWAGWDVGKGSVVPSLPRIVGGGPGRGLLRAGDRVTFGAGVFLDVVGGITIGDGATCGHEVMLITGDHTIAPPPYRLGPLHPKPITIGRGAWLGSRVIVLPGVSIGESAVIGAGAVVTRDVPPGQFAAGIPARAIGPVRETGARVSL